MLLMDQRNHGMTLLGLCTIILCICFDAATGNAVFEVHHKYGGRGRATLGALKAHDDARRLQRRILSNSSAVDFPLGGNDKVTEAALYYTKLAIGTPPKDYYVQVDTGSDILWVNCGGCNKCPKQSSLGLELKQYDLKNSKSGKEITCDQDFCSMLYDGTYANCKPGKPCEYAVTYADGSTAEGFFVADNINFDSVTGNLKTTAMNRTFSFGCSAKQSGTQGTSTDRVDGIIGFGKANSSFVSQLSQSGTKIKRIFSHCLDGDNGGIFAIGQVVDPKLNSTPLISYENHYTVMLKKAEIGAEMVDIPAQSFFSTGRKAVIDSGATLAYFPDDVFVLLMKEIMGNHSEMKTHIVEPDLNCFNYNGEVDEGFPAITFHFKNSLTLKVFPHDYLLSIDKDEYCLGLHRGAMRNDDGEDLILIGDILLSNKLVLYDLENMTLGWTPYDCKSTIQVKDEESGNVYSVSSHNISPPPPPSDLASGLSIGRKVLAFFLFIIATIVM